MRFLLGPSLPYTTSKEHELRALTSSGCRAIAVLYKLFMDTLRPFYALGRKVEAWMKELFAAD